jgi:ABC-type metal ion transport system substrate-binding protein
MVLLLLASREAKNLTIKFSYVSNGNTKNHELKIGSINDNYYGHKYYGDNNYYTWENNSPSSNSIVNQLLEVGRFKKSNNDQELKIYYSFTPKT